MPSEIVLTVVQPKKPLANRKCAICGIRSGQKPIFMASLPLDEARCKKWVQLIGNEDLVYVPIERLHQLRKVCCNHFTAKDFNRKKTRIKKSAIPSLDLRRPPLPESMFAEFPYHNMGAHLPVPKKSMDSKKDNSYGSPLEDHTYACSGGSSGSASSQLPSPSADHNQTSSTESEDKLHPSADKDDVKEKNQSLLKAVRGRSKIKTKKRKFMDDCDAYIKEVSEETVPVKKDEEMDDTLVLFVEVTDESDVDDDEGYRITCDSESESGSLSPTRDMDVQSDTTDNHEEEQVISEIKNSVEEAVQNEIAISDIDRFSFNILASLEKTLLERSKIREELKTAGRGSCETFCDNFAQKAMQFSPVLAAELQIAVCVLLTKYININAKRKHS